MVKKSAGQFNAGDKVKVAKFKCDGVIKSSERGQWCGTPIIYTVELENGETRHFTAEELK